MSDVFPHLVAWQALRRRRPGQERPARRTGTARDGRGGRRLGRQCQQRGRLPMSLTCATPRWANSTSTRWCCRPASRIACHSRIPWPNAPLPPACRSCLTSNCCIQAVRASGSRARFVGITGTNGKSTTTALLAHILDRAGVPSRGRRQPGPSRAVVAAAAT